MTRVKLTANVLFSGVGMQERGINNSGLFDLEIISTSEIDKYAILSYAAVHNGLTTEQLKQEYSKHQTEIEDKRDYMIKWLTAKKIGFDFVKNKMPNWNRCNTKELYKYFRACKLNHNVGDIASCKELPYADLWTYSFPCFTGDTLVLTNRGYIEIKDVQIGDYVLTHNNEYKKVVASQCTGQKDTYSVNAMCFDSLTTTSNHKFFVRTRHRIHAKRNGTIVNQRYFDSPIWKECNQLTKNDYLGYAININSVIPKWEGIDFSRKNDKSIRHKNELQNLMDNTDFWWLIGRYVADGWCRQQGGIVICCGKHKKGQIEPYLEACKFNYTVVEEKTAYKYHISIKELESFVKQFGYKASGKFIPSFVIDMPIKLCKAFLDGYWSGDGCYTQGKYKASSVSKTLVYGIGQLVAKVYKRPFSIYKTKRKPHVVIEGRTVNQKDSYGIVFKKEQSSQDKAFYENGYIWFPINAISFTGKTEYVYDITVENDHSFTANGCIVHNCTDLSISGNQAGMYKELTRSGLVYEVTRLLEVALNKGNPPKYLLMENVDALVSKKFKPTFDALVEWFDEHGYNTYWQILNAKDHGVPQNRKRVFALHIRKDVDNGKFTFPKPYDNGVRLRDILDKNVDEKYYLSKEVQNRFQPSDNLDSNVIGSTAPPFRTIGQRDVVYNTQKIIGATCATDYKQPKQIQEK